MLTALRVEGLRSFTQPAEIRLAPITLLYGRNSSGKTTLLSALSLLRQTAEHGAEGMARLRSDGPLVDLGAFRNLVAGHDPGRTVWLGVDIEDGAVTWSADLAYRAPGELIRLRVAWEGGGVGARLDLERREEAGEARYAPLEPGRWPPPALVTWLAHLLGEPSQVHQAWAAERAVAEGESPVQDVLETEESIRGSLALWLWEIEQSKTSTRERATHAEESDDSEDAPPTGLFGNSDALGMPGRAMRAAALLDDEPVHERIWLALDSVLARFESAVSTALSTVRHLGPVRTPPERTIVLSEGRSVDEVGHFGEETFRLLADEGTQRSVNAWLERMEADYQVNPTERDAFTGREIRTTLEPIGQSPDGDTLLVTVADVGFGVSQLLPVIVQFVVASGRLLMIEQPELHVHPALQGSCR